MLNDSSIVWHQNVLKRNRFVGIGPEQKTKKQPLKQSGLKLKLEPWQSDSVACRRKACIQSSGVSCRFAMHPPLKLSDKACRLQVQTKLRGSCQFKRIECCQFKRIGGRWWGRWGCSERVEEGQQWLMRVFLISVQVFLRSASWIFISCLTNMWWPFSMY